MTPLLRAHGTIGLQTVLPVTADSLMRRFDHLEKISSAPTVTWLRVIDTNVQSANIGIHSTWRKANDRKPWDVQRHGNTVYKGLATEEVDF